MTQAQRLGAAGGIEARAVMPLMGSMDVALAHAGLVALCVGVLALGGGFVAR